MDNIETADELMKQFFPTSIESTDLFYKDNGDIDDTYIRNNYQAHTIKPKSVRWNPVLTETNDGEPFIPLHKQCQPTKPAQPILDKQPTDNNENFSDNHPLKTSTVIERNDFLYLEREDTGGEIFYDEIPLYEDVQRSINLIKNSVQHWSGLQDSSIIHQAQSPHNIAQQLQIFAEV